MKIRYDLLLTAAVMLLVRQASAQENYVANGPASDAPGSFNTLIGLGVGFSVTGNSNTYVGYQAAKGGSSGSGNAFFGYKAGFNSKTGDYNTFMGFQAGNLNRSGNQNVFLGNATGYLNDSGSSNIFIGSNAGQFNTIGNQNVFIGNSAGGNNSTAGNNVAIGSQAGSSNQNGTQNTMLGFRSGTTNTASANTFVGYQTGLNNTTGQFNTFMGVNAGVNNTTGNSNFIMGTNAGRSNTTGSGNFFLGDNTAGGNTTGGYNVYLGTNSGDGAGVNGNNNVAIGYESGRQNVGGETNLFLGFRADAGLNGLINATALGPNARVNSSNSVVLGYNANVGIGSSSPTAKLEVVSGTVGVSGLKLTSIGTTATALNQTKFLTVTSDGTVVLGTASSSGRIGAELWEAKGEVLQNTNAGVVVIGQRVNKTPAGYKLFVEDGILTERVKVAVKGTADWSDKVFAPAYRLQSLSEVEGYIKANQHLPGVASAKEMVEQGNDLHQTDAKLLEKIEELTLYSIQLEKQNRQQRKINQQQIQELLLIKQKQIQLEELIQRVLKQN